MKDKICVVTGATSGIGTVTALELAKRGALVVLACRNPDKAKAVKRDIIEKTGNPSIETLQCDLASLKSVRSFAAEFRKKFDKLHVLVNNAGLVCMEREETEDGIEKTFGTNHLGPFLLTNLLLDAIKAGSPARVVNVASAAHFQGKIDFDDIQSKRDYAGLKAYANSKLANVLFTYDLARRLEGAGVTVNCLHPGVVATGIWPDHKWYFAVFSFLVKKFVKNVEDGAKTTVYLATSKDVEGISGAYFDDLKQKRSSVLSHDANSQKKLRDISEEMTGLR